MAAGGKAYVVEDSDESGDCGTPPWLSPALQGLLEALDGTRFRCISLDRIKNIQLGGAHRTHALLAMKTNMCRQPVLRYPRRKYPYHPVLRV